MSSLYIVKFTPPLSLSQFITLGRTFIAQQEAIGNESSLLDGKCLAFVLFLPEYLKE